jgi:ELWxxDGT repeat protein
MVNFLRVIKQPFAMRTKHFLFVLVSFFISNARAQEVKLLTNLSKELATSEFRLMESVEMGGNVYFTTWSTKGTELWRSNGQTAALIYRWPQAPFKVDYAVNKLYVYNNQLLFTGIDSVHGKELWTSDGTTPGTYMLKDLVPGKQSGFDVIPTNTYDRTDRRYYPFTICDGGMCFVSLDSVYNHSQVWVTDGSVRGTTVLQPFNPAPSMGIMPEVGFLNGKFFLGAIETTKLYGTYVSDGTSTGSSLLVDGTLFKDYLEYQGKLLFNSSGVRTFWSSDGSVQNTVVINGEISCSPDHLMYNNLLYFFNGRRIEELFSYGGTSTGLRKIVDTISSPNIYYVLFPVLDFHLHFPVVFKGKFYFCGAKQLWKSDGTPSGTEVFKNFDVIPPFYMSPSPQALIATGNKMYFKAFDSARVELFETDGSSSGTRKITHAGINYFETDLLQGALPTARYPNESMILFGNKLLFTEIYDTSIGKALYMIDVAPLSVHPTETVQSELKVYPNPATSSLSIRYPENQFDQAIVLDVLGRSVYKQSINKKGNDVLNLPELAPGQYFVRMSGSGHSISAPVIIQR